MTDKKPSTSASRMRKHREKRKKEDPNFIVNEAKRICELRKRKRESLSESELKAIRLKERDKKRLQRARKRAQAQKTVNSSVNNEMYKSKQALAKAVIKAFKALPKAQEREKR